jgi:hypothetical protein
MTPDRFAPVARRLRLDPLEDRTVPTAFGFGSPGIDTIRTMTADPAGNLYVAGTFTNSVDFDPGPGTAVLTNTGLSDSFLAKYTAAGALLWAGQLDASLWGLTVDPAGAIVATGDFFGTTDFDLGPGASTLTTGTGSSCFVVKYTPNGGLVWAGQLGGQAASVSGQAVAVDDVGDIYVGGSQGRGIADLDPGPGTFLVENTGDRSRATVTKLTSAGDLVWARHFANDLTTSTGVVYALGVDAAHNVYAGGRFQHRVDFDPGPGTNYVTTSAASDWDAYAVQLTAGGDFGYVVHMASTSNESVSELTVDADGTAYVVGNFNWTMTIDATAGDTTLGSNGADGFVLRLDPAGALDWARGFGSTGYDDLRAVVRDDADGLYLAGAFSGTVDFDPGPGVQTLTAAGETDGLVLRLRTDGTFRSAWGFGGTATDYGVALALVPDGQVAVAGDFFGTGDFDPGPGVSNLTSAGGVDAYVAVFPHDLPEAENGTLTTPEDTPATGTLVATGPPLTYVLVDTSAADGTVTITDPATGAYLYTPDPDYTGPASFTFKATAASGQSNVATVSITVRPVNDAPAFVKGPDQVLTEGAGPQDVPGWATGIAVGPANEAGQALTFQVTTDNDALFDAPPQITPGGTLTYTPAPDAVGTVTLTVTLSDDGGTADGGIDTSAPQTFTLTITGTNDAPVLTGDAELMPVPRNITNPAGEAVGDFAGPTISDPDGPPTGIAVVGSSGTATEGIWEYSTTSGQSWSPLGASSAAAARLLRDTDLVRFVPAPGFVGTVTLTYHAWDRTTGAAGQTADLTPGLGGATAFSTAAGTGTLQVGVTLTPVAEDTRSPKGDKVAALLSTFVTDPDLKAKAGIAVVGVANGAAGTWQYSVTGGRSWKPLVASPARAVLLRSTDRLRFLPAANAAGLGFIRYRAWDRTTGKAGTVVPLPVVTGGGTAFSAARGVGFAEVTAVNDAPVLDVGGEPPLVRVPPTATDPAGDRVADLVGSSATDAERDPVGIAVTAATGKGTWQFRPDGSADWVDVGPVSAKAPRFLGPLDRVRFVPTGGGAGSARLKFKAWDGQLVSKATEAGTLLVTTDPAPPANAAPVLDPTPTPAFEPVPEDMKAPPGDAVLALLAQAVTDPDPLALRGIAVTGLTGTANGRWQYSTTNGKTWKAVGTVSDASALLLRDLDRLRFLPGKDFHGTATMTFRAWDRTRGTAGVRADVRDHGGTMPFSAESETAAAAVHPVNDAPVLNVNPVPRLTPVLPTETDPAGDLVSALIGGSATDVDGDAVGIAVTAVSGPGVWQSREAGAADWTPILFAAPTFPTFLGPAARLRFVPTAGAPGVAKLAYRAWDGTATGVATETVSMAVNGVDDPPVLNTAGSPALTPVAANGAAPAGDLVSALLGSAVIDPDPAADLGIAVTGAASKTGTWEVMTNGATWEALGPVSPKAPRRLRAADRIRFVPAAGIVGVVKLSFKAWDAGSTAPGGPLALSRTTGTAVVFVNSAPVLRA